MKRLGQSLLVLAVAAVATGAFCYRLSSAPALHAAVARHDAMAWLRADFHLTDRQFEAIKKLHDDYAPGCEEHCRRIKAATQARDALRARHDADPAAAAEAERTLAELRTTCETAIGAHVRKVAALMSPEDGRRYLAMVLPKIAEFDHQMAPPLDLGRQP